MTGLNPVSRHTVRLALAGFLVTHLAACSSGRQLAMEDPFNDVTSPSVAVMETSLDSPDIRTEVAPQIEQVAYQVEQPKSAPGLARVPSHRPLIEQVSLERMPLSAQAVQYATEYCPPEIRQPLPPTMAGHPQAQLSPLPRPEHYADEYLFDGGDREFPVHYGPLGQSGLDTEDTVAEFTQHTGKRKIVPSNRVAVYAPRFAAVRSVSVPYQETGLGRVAGSNGSVGGTQMHARSGTAAQSLARGGQSLRIRSRASGFEGEVGQSATVQVARLAGHEKLLNTFEGLMFVRTGFVHQDDAARIGEAIQAALIWSREDSPIILGQVDAYSEVTVLAAAGDYTEYEDWRKNPGNIRIVKLADKSEAKPGEVIEFTIRFDNLGDFPVEQVRIIDKLTSRLEYVADSAAADREGEMTVETHEQGSVTLQWDFAQPLDHNEGGVITFQARVR